MTLREADPNTVARGGMIALLPADPAPLTVDHPAADPADELHVTLAFLGSDVTSWDPARRAAVVAAARDAAVPLAGPLPARVMGHATFNPDGGPDGDRDPCAVHLIGDSAELGPLRDRLVANLAGALGDDLRAQHAPVLFHATAGYGLTAADLTYTGPVVFDRVLVALAGERTTLPLAAAAERVRLAEVDHTDHGHDEVRTAILAARAAAFAANRARLRRAVAAYTATAPADLIREAIDPHAIRARRKAQAGLAIAATLQASGQADAWRSANRTNRDHAYEVGAACGAHQASGGDVPIDLASTPASGGTTEKRRRRGVIALAAAALAALAAAVISRRRNRIAADPDTDIDDQIDGLAGDLADLYRTDPDSVTDADVAEALEAAAGVETFADMQWSGAFLDGAVALYADGGAAYVNWYCCLPGCAACQVVMSENPYPIHNAPGPVHPGCDDWVEPAEAPG